MKTFRYNKTFLRNLMSHDATSVTDVLFITRKSMNRVNANLDSLVKLQAIKKKNMESCEYTQVTNITETNESQIRSVQWKPFMRQLLICSGAFTSMFVYGLSVGAPTVFIPQLRKEVNSTYVITDDMAAWLNSVIFLSAIPLTVIVSIITNAVGKKITIMISIVDILAAYILLYCSSNITHIMISQIIQSFYSASQMVILPMIFAEFTSPRYRGTFMLINAATFYWGIWVSNAIGTFFYWKIIPLFGMVCVSYMVLTLFLWPESPYWLASKGKFDECATAHRWLKGRDEESERELETLINSLKEHITISSSTRHYSKKDQMKNIWKTIKSEEFYKPTLISLALVSTTHYCGKALCIVYALDIIKQITNSESTAYIGMLVLDGVTVVSMYAGCILTRYLRRRTMVLVSSSIVVVFLMGLSLYLYLIKLTFIIENKYITIVLLSAYSLAAGCGPLIMGWAFFGELVPTKSRNLAVCLTCFISKTSIAILIKITPLLYKTFGMHGFFLFFGMCSLILIVILYKYLPETKDKTMQEIANSIRGIKTKTLKQTGELLVST